MPQWQLESFHSGPTAHAVREDEINQVHATRYLVPCMPARQRDIIPMSYPQTHQLYGFPMIAQSPLEDWKEANRPCFTSKSWWQLAMSTTSKGMVGIHNCFEIAKKKQ